MMQLKPIEVQEILKKEMYWEAKAVKKEGDEGDSLVFPRFQNNFYVFPLGSHDP